MAKSHDTFKRPQAKSKCGAAGSLSWERSAESEADPLDSGTFVQITIPLLRYRRLQIEGQFEQGELDELARNDSIVFQSSGEEREEAKGSRQYEESTGSATMDCADDTSRIYVVGAANASVDPVSGRYCDGIPKRLLEIHGTECHRVSKLERRH